MNSLSSLYSKLCSNLCSKSSTHEGGHTVLNSNTLGGGEVDDANPLDHRDAAAKAAERRATAAKQRGTKDGGRNLAQKSAAAAEVAAQQGQAPVWD